MGPEDICKLSEVFVHTQKIITQWAGIPDRKVLQIFKEHLIDSASKTQAVETGQSPHIHLLSSLPPSILDENAP